MPIVDMSKDESLNKAAAKAVVDFLKSNVPKGDVDNIEAELKKDFILAKRRSKGFKKKSKKKKNRCLTRKEKKALGFYNIPRDSVKYEDVLPIHKIWTSYMTQVLELNKPIPDYSNKSWDNFTQTLYKADFHGSMLKVVRSKCPSHVSKMGVCIMDTKNTFKIVSKDNMVTTIPKRECVFEMYVNKLKFTLFGKHFCIRPAERSTKKVKSHLHPDL